MSGDIFLGIEIRRSEDEVSLTQQRYARNVLERFRMSNAKGASSPLGDVAKIIDTTGSPPTKAPYREAIGSLLYIANCARPDLLFSVNLMARFNQEPTECNAVRALLRRHMVFLHIIFKSLRPSHRRR